MSPVHLVAISIVPCAARSNWFSSLYGFSEKTDSLLFLDLSYNSIQNVEGLPSKAKIMLSHNDRPLDFAPGVLTEAHGLSFKKGTIPDRLYVLTPKTLHAPERSRKCQGYFLLATPGHFFQKCLYTLTCLCFYYQIKYSSRGEPHPD